MNTPTDTMTADDAISLNELLRATRKRIDGGVAQHGEPWAQGGRAAVNFIEQRAARVMRREMAAVYAERDALRAVLREFQDGRRISNPQTRQVARDIEQQALARATGEKA